MVWFKERRPVCRTPRGAWALAFVVVALLFGPGEVRARQAAEGVRTAYTVRPAGGAIRVDGSLDDPGWKGALVMELPYEVQPGENVPAPVATRCRITYDRHHLYIGCRAEDPKPSEIRARLTDRDSAWDDDFLGVILDTFNDRRSAYEFFVNPLGVQMDLRRSEVGGGEDASWDAIWSSAGRLTSTGYVVEMAIPFSVLRFPAGGGELTWGISLVRVWPRQFRHELASEPNDRNMDCDLCQVSRIRGFAGIEPGRSLELDPTLVLTRTGERTELPDGPMATGPVEPDGGITARWGVTPNLEFAATVNPDFSQVEADVAQLDVNRTFSLFYPEKRPFFLEGADLFDTPYFAINTRAISDPNWGLKITGKEGRSSFAALAAQDTATSVIVPGSQGSWSDTLPGPNLAGIFRYRYDLGTGSTLGALVTAREGEGGYNNRVFGLDGHLRLGDSDTLRFQALGSSTDYPSSWAAENEVAASVDGNAFRVRYEHDSRNWSWDLRAEDRGAGFRADLGFIPQVDVRAASASLERTWWGEPEDWYTSIELGARWSGSQDHSGQILDREAEIWGSVAGPWQSRAWLNLTSRDVFYAGEMFDQCRMHLFLRARPSGGLSLRLLVAAGDEVDYDNVRPADLLRLRPTVEVAVGRHLRFSLRHTSERLDVDGGRLYRASLSEFRGVYQFSLRTFVRAILQYTDLWRNQSLYREDVPPTSRSFFTQLLFSYKINPQTVFFLGYSETGLGEHGWDMAAANRTLFLKVGYAWLL